MSDSARIVPIFPTAVFSQSLDGHVALDRELVEAITAKRSVEKGVSISNVGGWQSSNDMVRWGGMAAARVAEYAVVMATKVTVSAKPGWRASFRPEMWANINGPGDSNQSHWHPGSYLSAVYYADDGYNGSTDSELGGELVLIDPRMPYLHMRTPDLYICDSAGKSSGLETWVRPTSGLMVIFPSYLAHSVRPYKGQHRRITIAINLVADLVRA